MNDVQKKGVTAFGFVSNLKSFVQEANNFILDTERPFLPYELNKLVDDKLTSGNIEYINKFGKKCDDKSALYAIFETDRLAKNSEPVLLLYKKPRPDKSWGGISYCTRSELISLIKDNSLFRIGKLEFDVWQEGLKFLEELKTKSIPETWSYQNHSSTLPNPILKSYIENTLEKLLKESGGKKILRSDDNKFIVFNSGLLDRFFHEIYIIANVVQDDSKTVFRNPYLMNSLTDLTRISFTVSGNKIVRQDDLPEPASYFRNVNEVIFDSNVEIDRNYEKFTHIIEERRSRFPLDEQSRDTTELARKLDNAINYAIAVAKRNYKLVVPMYRPQEDKIQLLMPIYLSGSFTKHPDFALVLDLEHGIYTPETILPLDAAYQNARLIAKPDELWLNPNDI